MLRWRLVIGSFLIVTLVVLCWLDARPGNPVPGIWLVPGLVFFGLLGTHEILALTEAAGLRPLRWATFLGSLLILGGSLLPALPMSIAATTPMLCSSAGLAIAVIVILVGEIVRYEKPGGAIANFSAAIFSVVYVAFLLSFAVQLRLQFGLGAMISLIVAVKAGDTGAYTVGRVIGRRKMAPKLSPGKTLEGAAGAVIFAALGSWATFHWMGSNYNLAGVLAYGIALGIAGMLGDLAESLMKRDCGRKDSSAWMPGLGGVLDVVDSILLASPVAYLWWVGGLLP